MSTARAAFLFICFIFFGLSFVSRAPVAHAQSATDIQFQIDENKKKLDAIEAEIKTFQKQLNALGEKKNTLQSTISSLTLSQKQLAAQIQATENKIASAALKIKQLTLSIGDKEEAITIDKNAISKAIRSTENREQTPLIAVLISSNSLGDAWKLTDEAAQFTSALSKDVEDLRAARTELATNRDEISAVKAKHVALQKDLIVQKKSVDLNKAAQQKLLADTKNQESTYQKLIADKQAEESRFETALFELASKLEFVLDPSRVPPAGKGVLRWPLDGVFVTQFFGKSSSAQRLYTSGSHDGIDFRASIGTPIRASLSGTVLEVNYGAAQNCQYGKWVLIKHPNGLATLYAHLSDISVQKNAVVVTGQVVGYSGNTGYATGPHLHFGVYLADAISLKQYTCKNGQRVTIPIAPISAYLNPLSYL